MNLENTIGQFFNRRIIIHLGFWTALLIFAFFGEVGEENSFFDWMKFLHLAVHFAGFVMAVYINLYILIPRFLIRKNFVGYSFLVLAVAVSSTILTQQLQLFVNHYILNGEIHENTFFLFFHISFYCIFIMMLTTMFYFLRRRMSMQELELKLQETRKQQVMSELQALKSQVNPHFFFNALNSLYSLSLENSPKTPGIVLKLSALMRYVLYESSTEKILLIKEFEFVKNYIELEQSRFENTVNVKLEMNKPENDIFIAPLIFIPFIENAFKHCSKTGSQPPEITIRFDTSQLPKLLMSVENTKENTEINFTGKGVGLENVIRRLNLIYNGKHQLRINDQDQLYKVQLEIDLS